MSLMMTLVSPQPHADLDSVLRDLAPQADEIVVLSDSRALEALIETIDNVTELRAKTHSQSLDLFITAAENRRKKLLVADMDSTIVGEETLDELAAHAGFGDQVAAITERAMNSELDFHAAIKERVGLLEGLPETALNETLAKTTVTQGAKTLIATMKNHGATCVLTSGGFTFFTGAVAEMVGFDAHHGNVLEIENGVLTGRVVPPILDKNAKLSHLQDHCTALNITPQQALTLGDGANDLPMLEAAGLGIGYRPRPVLQTKITNHIRFNDLSAALYAQGYKDSEITLCE